MTISVEETEKANRGYVSKLKRKNKLVKNNKKIPLAAIVV